MNSFGRDVTRPYLRALEARHIPHVLVKGGSFNEREEVIAMRNILGAIERPDDELAVFAALRGPVFALTDAALLEFRMTQGRLHPFRKPARRYPRQSQGSEERARRDQGVASRAESKADRGDDCDAAGDDSRAGGNRHLADR